MNDEDKLKESNDGYRRENFVLWAILARETCDCDLVFEDDDKAIKPAEHSPECAFVDIAEEITRK